MRVTGNFQDTQDKTYFEVVQCSEMQTYTLLQSTDRLPTRGEKQRLCQHTSNLVVAALYPVRAEETTQNNSRIMDTNWGTTFEQKPRKYVTIDVTLRLTSTFRCRQPDSQVWRTEYTVRRHMPISVLKFV